MSDTNAQEPTMEEILASIRRIISEDDAPPAAEGDTPPAAVQAASEPTHSAPPPPEPPAPEDDDVLELTNPLDVAAPQEPESAHGDDSLGDLDFSSPGGAPAPVPAPTGSAPEDTLVSGSTASAAASSFDQLSRSITMPPDGRTLEDVVNQLLKPLLKDWLDRNLPSIVESKVQAEVERIARSRGY